MADGNGPPSPALTAGLFEAPFAYDFFAAVRLLQASAPDKPRIGYSLSPAQDPVRFGQSPALDFAAATLEAIRQKDPDRPPWVYSRHFGLFGPNGPLPLCLTDYARERVLHYGDPTFVSFCNVFHHRLLSFFFRAWADAQKTVDFDRPKDQHWAEFVESVVGMGMESLLERDSIPDRAKLYFAGRLAHQPRNAEGLEAILRDFFGIPVRLFTFMGRWLRLPDNCVLRLGASPETGTLGSTAIVGSRFWTCQLHFRVRFGPMDLPEYERMLPNGSSFQRLRDWVRHYTGRQFSWDAQLVLKKDEVPFTQIGIAGRLGWTTWLKSKPLERDAQDLVIYSETV
jgi:type VI secretion system protein ImpH